MRFSRALKAAGCAVLPDSIEPLPYTEEGEEQLRERSGAISNSDGTACLSRALVSSQRTFSRAKPQRAPRLHCANCNRTYGRSSDDITAVNVASS
ncbi:hypothetical protein V4C53_29690 [Paraburkholderia azotifigens]|uniref:hypothetical protein n=1 Tax=Paraburkholderia azotifigens TaxID=2057004 RepID=UPI00317E4807